MHAVRNSDMGRANCLPAAAGCPKSVHTAGTAEPTCVGRVARHRARTTCLKNSRCPWLRWVAFLEGSSDVCECSQTAVRQPPSRQRRGQPAFQLLLLLVRQPDCGAALGLQLTVLTNPTYTFLSCGCFSVLMRKLRESISPFCAASMSLNAAAAYRKCVAAAW